MAIQLNSRFLSLIVHDLRTPLNVISLTLRLIDQALPQDNFDLKEDLEVVRENLTQTERMLAYLTDYCRLVDDPGVLKGTPFDPGRVLAELVEMQSGKSTVHLDVSDGCPAEVELDPFRARLALQHALANAVAAAEEGPVRVVLSGQPGRLVVEMIVDRPPPPSVHSMRLRPDFHERLFGIAQERRGLDLAIAARVSELFGGTARLDVMEGQGSAIVLDWPASLGPA